MNVVTSNQNKEIIDRLDIDIIKRIDGQFELRELLSKFVNLYFNKMIIDITSISNYQDIEIIKDLAKAVDPSRVILLLNNDPVVNSSFYIANLISCGFYNFTRNYEGIIFLYKTPNSYDNVAHLAMDEKETKAKAEQYQQEHAVVYKSNMARKVIGLVNLTNHAGATSLVNMLVRHCNAAGITAVGIEMFKQDLIFYHDSNLSTCFNKQDLENKLKLYEEVNVVFMDVNDFTEANKYCDKVLYLVEPSYVMLTKLLKRNKNVFAEHVDDLIVLNKSFVNDQEIPDFEYETKVKVFDNLPPMNDRTVELDQVKELLNKLGINVN